MLHYHNQIFVLLFQSIIIISVCILIFKISHHLFLIMTIPKGDFSFSIKIIPYNFSNRNTYLFTLSICYRMQSQFFIMDWMILSIVILYIVAILLYGLIGLIEKVFLKERSSWTVEIQDDIYVFLFLFNLFPVILESQIGNYRIILNALS